MDASELIPQIEKALPGAVVEIQPFGSGGQGSEPALWINPDSIREVAKLVGARGELHLDWLESLNVREQAHAKGPRLVLTYFLRSTTNPNRLILRAFVELNEGDRPGVPSVSSVWKMAEPMEAEVGELFGINFKGLRVKSALYEGSRRGFPLRKSFVPSLREQGEAAGVDPE